MLVPWGVPWEGRKKGGGKTDKKDAEEKEEKGGKERT